MTGKYIKIVYGGLKYDVIKTKEIGFKSFLD